ncbi:MAG: TorF family putative porin [Gallionellaceae bacterium]
MFKTKLLVIALGAAFAMPALAADVPAVTSNVGIVSDYIYRGLTQTSHAPAIQGGFDYAHASGFYAGVWGSNVSWIADSGAVTTAAGSYGPSMELDTYFGFKGTVMADVAYDVGAVRYNYLGSSYTPAAGFANADTAEAYVGVTYSVVTLKYSYGLLDRFLTTPNAGGTGYADLTVNYPVESLGATVVAHAGHQHFNIGPTDTYSYSDYKLAVTKDFGGYVAGLAYTKTNVSPSWTYGNQNWGKDAVAVSLTHAM